VIVSDTVMVVDDDLAIRELIAMVLTDEGYAVATATNGAEALTQLQQSPPPALVLLDLNMPVMSGWELQARLREELPDLPVVFMTAGQRAQEEARRHQAAGFLPKPFDLDHLLATVARFTA
jgi:CheY-like chemotaxis protein